MDYHSNSMEYNDDHFQRSYEFDHRKAELVTKWLMWAIGIISLPLNGAVIFATFSQVQRDVTRIYVMNLLVSDLLQLCFMMALLPNDETFILFYAYHFSLMASVGFRTCLALERCSVILCPRVSCFRQSIVCGVVCLFLWLVPLCVFIFAMFVPVSIVHVIYLLLPCPFLISTLVISLISLCVNSSVNLSLKHRVVGSVVLLVLVHMLLIIPSLIVWLSGGTGSYILDHVPYVILKLVPLADTFLYFFLTKRDTDNNLGNSVNRPVMNDESSHINSSV
ncbi:mas-related G-protein coupled receptor member A6-like [Betta splendens]|uniref:Mas-related G-protein coupled receptor member A6-like n=1 Tax=Betta splendens TaxID=158456 RepID=A0A8M1H5I4_BETSP|nr:mas-related G-protein coupled receptor member A6-like [Betta splendens]